LEREVNAALDQAADKSPAMPEVEIVAQHNNFGALEVDENLEDEDEFHSQQDDSENQSQCSDYVEDTQVQQQRDGSSLQHDVDGNAESSEIRNKRNAEFLKASWANIADDEEAEARLIQNLEKDHDAGIDQQCELAPFKLVQRKNKSPKKSKAASNSYKTRSKVPNSKPFK
jgi:hypothetical protein